MNVLKLTYLLGLSFFLIACSPDAYYKIQGESPVSKNRPISVVSGSAFDKGEQFETLEEKRFKGLLKTALKNNGYNLNQSNNTQKPCTLLFELTQSTQNRIGSYTTYNTSTTSSNVSGWVNGSYVYGRGTSTTTTPSTNTYSYQVTFKNIYTLLACPDSTGKHQAIWSGTMNANLSDYENNKENAISNLVELMEFDEFNGDLRIDTDKHVPFIKKHNKRKHYLTIGGDVAFSLGSMNFGTYHYADTWGYAKTADTTDLSSLSVPITLRIGYMHNSKKSVNFGINALYQIDDMSDDNTYDDNINVKSKRLGIEATMLIKDFFLIGLGIAKNINSNATINIDDYSYKAQFEKKIEATYGLWRLELLGNVRATSLYITMGLSGGWSLQNIDYAGSILAISAGLLYKL